MQPANGSSTRPEAEGRLSRPRSRHTPHGRPERRRFSIMGGKEEWRLVTAVAFGLIVGLAFNAPSRAPAHTVSSRHARDVEPLVALSDPKCPQASTPNTGTRKNTSQRGAGTHTIARGRGWHLGGCPSNFWKLVFNNSICGAAVDGGRPLNAIQVGANTGSREVYTLVNGRRGEKGMTNDALVDIIWHLPPGTLNILMYEPAPAVFEELKKNMQPFNATGNTVHLIKAAMGAYTGKFPFYYARPDLTPEEEPLWKRSEIGTMSASQILKHLKPENVRSYNCSLMNYQTAAALTTQRYGWQSIDLLNIDAEGQELNIISGMLGMDSAGPANVPSVVRYEGQGEGSEKEAKIKEMLHGAGYSTCADGVDMIAFRQSWDLYTYWNHQRPVDWPDLIAPSQPMCSPSPPDEKPVDTLPITVGDGRCAALTAGTARGLVEPVSKGLKGLTSGRWVWNKNFPALFSADGRFVTDMANCAAAKCSWVASKDTVCVLLSVGPGVPLSSHTLSVDGLGRITGERDMDGDRVSVLPDTAGVHSMWFNAKSSREA